MRIGIGLDCMEVFSVSISIGGSSLVPQQLAAPQQKPVAAAPVDIPRTENPPPRVNPPATGKVVDKTA